MHHFDQPTAAQNLIGLLAFIDDFTDRSGETIQIELDDSKKVIYLFVNCKSTSVKDAMNQKITSD